MNIYQLLESRCRCLILVNSLTLCVSLYSCDYPYLYNFLKAKFREWSWLTACRKLRLRGCNIYRIVRCSAFSCYFLQLVIHSIIHFINISRKQYSALGGEAPPAGSWDSITPSSLNVGNWSSRLTWWITIAAADRRCFSVTSQPLHLTSPSLTPTPGCILPLALHARLN